jgi:hypothetical protein
VVPGKGPDDKKSEKENPMGIKIVCLLTALVLTAGGLCFAQTSSAKAGTETGRYQLFQGTYTSIDLKRQQTSTHASVFLLDTQTGKVKRYLNKIDEDGKYIETWVPTETEKP